MITVSTSYEQAYYLANGLFKKDTIKKVENYGELQKIANQLNFVEKCNELHESKQFHKAVEIIQEYAQPKFSKCLVSKTKCIQLLLPLPMMNCVRNQIAAIVSNEEYFKDESLLRIEEMWFNNKEKTLDLANKLLLEPEFKVCRHSKEGCLYALGEINPEIALEISEFLAHEKECELRYMQIPEIKKDSKIGDFSTVQLFFIPTYCIFYRLEHLITNLNETNNEKQVSLFFKKMINVQSRTYFWQPNDLKKLKNAQFLFKSRAVLMALCEVSGINLIQLPFLLNLF